MMDCYGQTINRKVHYMLEILKNDTLFMFAFWTVLSAAKMNGVIQDCTTFAKVNFSKNVKCDQTVVW